MDQSGDSGTLFAQAAPLPKVTIYTDGACVPNPGRGGYAAVLLSGKAVKEITGGHPQTTNNRMELSAVIAALEALKRPCDVTLHSDSMIVVNLLNGRGKKPSRRENQDLVQRIVQLMQTHTIGAVWVKGHNGDPMNERCDALAMAEIQKLDSQLPSTPSVVSTPPPPSRGGISP